MIYFYNTELEFLEAVNEVSFSYSKKARKEGGGKVSLTFPPHLDAFYIIIYVANTEKDEEEYITSGYITELIEEKQGYSFQFKTFESLLKNYSLPKKWNTYSSFSIPQIVADLMFGFRPIYKTSKADLGILDTTNPTYLKSENIAFNSIEGADLTLAFDAGKQAEENVYYYCQKGFVIFQYDLGEPNFINLEYSEKSTGQYTAHYPKRILRWSEQVGEKTFIKWKAIERDETVKEADDKILEELQKAPTLQARRDSRKDSIEVGVPLPNKKRVLILQLIFEYIKPNYSLDFNTEEINTKASGKPVIVKRTVRGFTPVLHGFEILNRCPLAPFSLPTKKASSSISIRAETIIEVCGKLNHTCNEKEDTKELKFEGGKVSDILEKMQEVHHFNITFDLRKDIGKKRAEFYISMFTDEAIGCPRFHGRDLRHVDNALLRAPDSDAPLYANFTLSTMKRRLELPILLDCKGASRKEGIDDLHFLFYINYVLKGREYKREVFVYGADGISRAEFNEVLEVTPISQASIDSVRTLPYIEQTLDASNAKTVKEIAGEVLKYLIDKEKQVTDEVFEASIFQDIRLYDKVRILHSKSKKVYDVIIKEEKIGSKNGKLTKSVGLQGEMYNPFDCFFVKKKGLPIITLPTTPINVKASSHKNNLRIEWSALGAFDEFSVRIKRLDGVVEEGWEHYGYLTTISRENKIIRTNPSTRLFPTIDTKIELSTLSVDTIYRVQVASCYENKISQYSESIYIKMEDSDSHIRYLSSLDEEGEDGDEAYFYNLNLKDRRKIAKTIESLTDYIAEVFNSIEQITDIPIPIEYIEVLDETSNDELNGFLKQPIPYQQNPICNSWTEELYEEIYPYFGIYYQWRLGKWRERRFVTPKTPLFFFDLEERAFAGINDIKRHKDFAKRWGEYCKLVNSFQETREKINRMLAYNYYGEDSEPAQDAGLTPYSISSDDDNALSNPKRNIGGGGERPPITGPINPPGQIPAPINPNPGGPGRDLTPYPGGNNGGYVGPSDPNKPTPSEKQREELKKLKKDLIGIYDRILEVVTRVYEEDVGKDTSSIKQLSSDGAYEALNLYDASSNKNHAKYKIAGGELLTNVTSHDEEEYKRNNVEDKLPKNSCFLQNAFSFQYADFDNGGDEACEKIQKEPKKYDPDGSYGNIDSSSYEDTIKKCRLPFYEISEIPFFKKEYENASGYPKTKSWQFTFSTWLRFEDVSDGVCLWDIAGMCTGFVKDNKLHFGYRNITRKKIKREISLNFYTDVDDFEYPLQTMATYDYKNEDVEKNNGVHPYIHVMVLCKVDARNKRLPQWGTNKITEFYSYTIHQEIYVNFKKLTQNFFYFSCPYAERTKEELVIFYRYHKDKEKREYSDYMKEYYDNKYKLEKLPSLRLAYYEPKPHMPYVLEKNLLEIIDQTDYKWTHYKFDLSHLMLFEGHLTKLERFYFREFGIYPTKRLPRKYSDDASSGNNTSGEGKGKNYQNYLGVVNEKMERYSAVIKTTTSNNEKVIASDGNFVLLAKECKHFKVGVLYEWDGGKWVELTPVIKYLKEYKEAFADIKELPKVAEGGFYKELANFGMAICNGLFSSTLITDSLTTDSLTTNSLTVLEQLTVLGQLSLPNIPNRNPRKKGVLYRSNNKIYISQG